jgi:lysozyme family protein
MAKVEKLLSFIMKWEAGLNLVKYGNLPLDQQFLQAKKTGFANDPADSGGATMVGVTLGTYTEYCRRMKKGKPSVAQLKAMTYQEWLSIVKMFYWNRWKADDIKSQKVANILVDWVWSSGVWGIKKPQSVLGTAVDGLVGSKTLQSVNKADPDLLFKSLYDARVDYINDIVFSSIVRYEKRIGRKAAENELMKYTNKRFKNGWMRRLNDIVNLKE